MTKPKTERCGQGGKYKIIQILLYNEEENDDANDGNNEDDYRRLRYSYRSP